MAQDANPLSAEHPLMRPRPRMEIEVPVSVREVIRRSGHAVDPVGIAVLINATGLAALPVPVTDLEHHLHRALAQLPGVLPLCWHDSASSQESEPPRSPGGPVSAQGCNEGYPDVLCRVRLGIRPPADALHGLAHRGNTGSSTSRP